MHNSQIKEELDFKDLIKNPIRLFGYSYFYFFTILIGLGIYYVINLTDMSKNQVPPSLSHTLSTETELPMMQPSNIPPIDISQISIPTEELIEKGELLYKNNCASCHGDDGKGDGAAGLVMNPKPKNFTQALNWINGRKISDIYKTLDEGILKNGMPSYSYLTAEDRFSIIHFIRTFAQDFPVDSEEELQLLNSVYKLSEGRVTTAQIPVKVARKKVLEENKSKLEDAARIVERFSNPDFEYDHVLFNELFINKKLIAGFLVSDYFAKSSKTEIYEIIIQAPLNYGFHPRISKLLTNEWDELYRYLIKLREPTRS